MGEEANAEREHSFPKVIWDFDPNNLPPEYLQAIGLVAMASAQTESVMQSLVGGLLQIDNIETLALTAHLNAPVMDHIARSLIELNATDAKFVDEVDRLLDAVEAAHAKRNIALHNSLCRNPESNEIFSHRLKARGSLQLELRRVAVEEILQDAKDIYDAGMAVQQFMTLYGVDPLIRRLPLREPLNRSRKAREERSDAAARPAGTGEPEKYR